MTSKKLYMNCFLLLVFIAKKIGRKVHMSQNNMHEDGQNSGLWPHVTFMFPKEMRLSEMLASPGVVTEVLLPE